MENYRNLRKNRIDHDWVIDGLSWIRFDWMWLIGCDWWMDALIDKLSWLIDYIPWSARWILSMIWFAKGVSFLRFKLFAFSRWFVRGCSTLSTRIVFRARFVCLTSIPFKVLVFFCLFILTDLNNIDALRMFWLLYIILPLYLQNKHFRNLSLGSKTAI